MKQSFVGHKSWKGQEHSHVPKPLQDQRPTGKGNSKRWRADDEQKKHLPAEEVPILLAEAIIGEAAQAVTFSIPCRSNFLGTCRYGDNCKFLHSPLKSVSDDQFDSFIKNFVRLLPPLTMIIYGTYLLRTSSEWSTQVRCTKS